MDSRNSWETKSFKSLVRTDKFDRVWLQTVVLAQFSHRHLFEIFLIAAVGVVGIVFMYIRKKLHAAILLPQSKQPRRHCFTTCDRNLFSKRKLHGKYKVEVDIRVNVHG